MNIDFPRFVHYTGFYNIALAFGVVLSAWVPIVGVHFCHPAWAIFIG